MSATESPDRPRSAAQAAAEQARLSVIVCKGPSCSVLGGEKLEDWCLELIVAGLPIDFEISTCTGNCMESPVVQWNNRYVTEATPERLTELLVEEDAL